jgi:hypothetical protein
MLGLMVILIHTINTVTLCLSLTIKLLIRPSLPLDFLLLKDILTNFYVHVADFTPLYTRGCENVLW